MLVKKNSNTVLDTESYLTPEEIQSFKALIQKKFGIDVPDEFAENQGTRLGQAFELQIQHKKSIANTDEIAENEVKNE